MLLKKQASLIDDQYVQYLMHNSNILIYHLQLKSYGKQTEPKPHQILLIHNIRHMVCFLKLHDYRLILLFLIVYIFANYFRHNSDMTVDLSNNSTTILDNHSEDWKVTMVDTGLNTQTGGRLKKVQKYIGNERFLLTYGDGVTDLNIADSVRAHERSGCAISLTAYKPGGKFGALQLDLDTDKVLSFQEKPDGDRNWINAGYFVCEPEVFDYIPAGDDTVVFERQPLELLAADGKMHAYRHTRFWKPMDTLRDNTELNELWNQGKAPWKVW